MGSSQAGNQPTITNCLLNTPSSRLAARGSGTAYSTATAYSVTGDSPQSFIKKGTVHEDSTPATYQDLEAPLSLSPSHSPHLPP